jgi:hypothetical protein
MFENSALAECCQKEGDGQVDEMTEFYLSVATVVAIAVVAAVLLHKKPKRILYIIIISNIFFAMEAAYFISWLAVAPCLFIIAFMTVIVTSPQMNRNPYSDE